MTTTKIETTPEEALEKFELDPTLAADSAVQEKAKRFADAVAAGEEPDALSEEEKSALYVEATEIKAAQERLTERLEQIKESLRTIDGYGTKTLHAGTGGGVTLGHNPVFNEARFLVAKPYDHEVIEDKVIEGPFGKKKIVPTKVYPNRELYKITPDRTAMKRILPEAELKSYFDEGQKKVTIR